MHDLKDIELSADVLRVGVANSGYFDFVLAPFVS